MSAVRGIVRGEAGAGLVETALSASVLLLLVFGIFEISLALYSYHCIGEAAREGSRYAMVRGSTSCVNTPSQSGCNASVAQIQSYVKGIGFSGVDSGGSMNVFPSWLSSNGTASATWSDCTTGICNVPGNLVKVQVTYQFPLRIPFWPGTSITLQSTSQMVIAQ
jgi:Flp pilus assembly protein TadG